MEDELAEPEDEFSPSRRQNGPRQAIGQDICERRKALGLTQRQLADMTQVSEDFVARLENGTANTDTATLLRLALALKGTYRVRFEWDEVTDPALP